jgi:SPP1 gp7 family putative phage head morphogenesis protein
MKLAFDMPMKEAQAFWGAKVPMSRDDWDELIEAQRAGAFMVSGLTRTDQISAVQQAISDAIDTGTTFEDFKAAIPDIIARQHWSGIRLQIIFRTNVQSAYMAGRYAQMQKVAQERPFWQYSAINDSRTRPAHRAMDGKIFPADHEFWNTWYPPNGFRCFPPWEKVRTPSGWVDIAEILPDDRIIGGSGQEKLVEAVHRNPFDGHLFRLVFEDGFIDTTPNHRILTMRGWVRANELNSGDILVETIPLPAVDALIRDEHMTDADVGDSYMAFPIQREPSRAFTADGKIDVRNEHIEPSRAGSCHYDMIMNALKPKIGDMIKHLFLGSGRHLTAGGMCRRQSSDIKAMGMRVFFTYLRASCRRRLSQFFSRRPCSAIGFLGFARSWVSALNFHPSVCGAHLVGSHLPALHLGVNPLSFNSLSALSRFNIKMPQQSHNRAGVHFPSVTEHPVGKLFDNVQPKNSVGSGDFLDGFDSLKRFVCWARSHCVLRKLRLIRTIPYTGIVYNLSVEGDRSYIVQGATVHNCRCGVVTLSAREIERDGLAVETEDPTGKLYEPTDITTGNKMPARLMMPDSGFSGNVGKDWLSGLAPDAIGHMETQFSEREMPDSIRAFLRELGSDDGKTVVVKLPGGFVLAAGPEMFKLPDGSYSARAQRIAIQLAQTLKAPDEAWVSAEKADGRIYHTLTMIRDFKGDTIVFRLFGGKKWAADTGVDLDDFRKGLKIK